MFAIASDDVSQVQRVLDSGEANPNDQVGPESALKFALTNDQLTNRLEIVKTLLAYGADPAGLKNSSSGGQEHSRRSSVVISGSSPAHVGHSLNASEIEGRKEVDPVFEAMKSRMDPATRYFINRADAPKTRRTSALIHRSIFHPLARMRYDVIGQDCAFEQLFRCLSIQSQNLSVSPLVVMLCGPSGHGKSLFARKFGSLLGVPTHTVNMTTLKSTHDLWQSYSMSPYEEPSTLTLDEFLTENEGKRCVVVLDEIDKVDKEKTLFSLLMPWELGKCSFTAGKRHVNARSVIWIATANTGHQLVFDHQAQRADPDAPMDRKEYMELINLLRPDVTECLGASLISRVTTVLPFVPFTSEEKLAIASQALFLQGGEHARLMSPEIIDRLVADAVAAYIPSEGGRSLYRAVSSLLLDAIDLV
ncbi:P-loop containing nucleoside triphosphate hydrolase protein [Thelephora ganbajun]|uniref:P-loop containing nucleoside triphosphate hydrolase protein n=1 Tax=Thelephora ganbajun TaxID=370292 RepID=A0ACB6ZTC0_THEGA|nr:P-loop containing nucleoside triphosphate hydrolase protein [Thelephora ganbajun]